jgi:hypothetical protein
LSAEDRLAYNIGQIFGQIKTVSGPVSKVGAGIAARPALSVPLQRGTTGLIVGGLQQLQKSMDTGKFDFEEMHRTGGWFAMFGLAEVGVQGASNAYKAHKFFQTPQGQKALATLSKSEVRKLVEIKRQTEVGS